MPNAATVIAAPGTVLAGKLRVERLIGQGAMGIVYEATDITLRRRVAVKLVHPDFLNDAEKRLRYRLNYVVIDGLNDEASQIAAILDVLEPVRNRSVLRVSRLNETNASRRNGLRRPSVQSVKNVVGIAQERDWDLSYGKFTPT